eukprot:scaffold8047_cov417-Prasinococcus_capsulatus_cf.AAC.9
MRQPSPPQQDTLPKSVERVLFRAAPIHTCHRGQLGQMPSGGWVLPANFEDAHLLPTEKWEIPDPSSQ